MRAVTSPECVFSPRTLWGILWVCQLPPKYGVRRVGHAKQPLLLLVVFCGGVVCSVALHDGLRGGVCAVGACAAQ
ncbi:hypothetical protein FOA52_011569 [Chlamydomonas sp. UWO 241]|nr:hypothetical protein FOA52_011569 [Chlamydomonas sp. UWO 241]